MRTRAAAMASNEAGPLDWMRAVRDWTAPLARKAILWSLILRADRDGRAWPSLETIARDAGTSRASVTRAISAIESDTTCPLALSRTRRCETGRAGDASNLYALRPRRHATTPAHGETGSQGDTGSQGETGSQGDTDPGSGCTMTPAQGEPLTAHRTAHRTAQGSLPGLAGAPTGGNGPVKVKTKQRQAKAEPEATPGFLAVRDCYFAEYESARGVKPPFGSREGKAIKVLLESMDGDAERACQCIVNAFADPFWRDKVTINSIASDPAKFDGKRSAPDVRRSGHPKQGGGFVDTSVDIDDLMKDNDR